jgi:hypothetical protein
MNDLGDYPGGCGNTVHRRASECPRCGFRAEVEVYHEVLGSLGTISSILLGFGLAGIISLTAAEPAALRSGIIQGSATLWVVSSLLLLVVLVLSELVRQRGQAGDMIALSEVERSDIARRCNELIGWFVLALIVLAAGIVVFSFFFGLWLGLIAVAASGGGLLVAWRVLR